MNLLFCNSGIGQYIQRATDTRTGINWCHVNVGSGMILKTLTGKGITAVCGEEDSRHSSFMFSPISRQKRTVDLYTAVSLQMYFTLQKCSTVHSFPKWNQSSCPYLEEKGRESQVMTHGFLTLTARPQWKKHTNSFLDKWDVREAYYSATLL